MTFGRFNFKSGAYGDTDEKMKQLQRAAEAAGLGTASFIAEASQRDDLIGGSISRGKQAETPSHDHGMHV